MVKDWCPQADLGSESSLFCLARCSKLENSPKHPDSPVVLVLLSRHCPLQ